MPIIFEAVPGIAIQPQLWICTSGLNPAYGGCSIWLSTDGGSTYGATPIGNIIGRQKQGLVYNATYPSHVDPDNTNTLSVDLSQSLGNLLSYDAVSQACFIPLCYIAGGGTVAGVGGSILTIPYELVSIGATTLNAQYKYSCTPAIRRGVYRTPIASHSVGSQFSYLNDDLVFKWNLPNALVGTTLFFKFASFNTFGQKQQSLSDVSAVTFTPSGQVGFNQVTYSISPQPTVYQGQAGGWVGIDGSSSTWTVVNDIYFPPVTATFNTGLVLTYAARDSGIVAFSGAGQTVWVTIYDPTLQGEPSGVASLNVFADANQTKWNTPGYIRIGTLTSAASGGSGGGGGGLGGTPPPASDTYIYVPPVAGVYDPNQELYFSTPVRNIILSQNLIGSHAGCRVAPAGSVSVVLKKNGSSIGTVDIAASATVATFTFTSGVSFNGTTDNFTVVAPSSPDPTFAGFWCDLQALRSN